MEGSEFAEFIERLIATGEQPSDCLWKVLDGSQRCMAVVATLLGCAARGDALAVEFVGRMAHEAAVTFAGPELGGSKAVRDAFETEQG